MNVSNLDIQYIDEDEASEDISVVERELNDDYQPKSVRINEAGKKLPVSLVTLVIHEYRFRLQFKIFSSDFFPCLVFPD